MPEHRSDTDVTFTIPGSLHSKRVDTLSPRRRNGLLTGGSSWPQSHVGISQRSGGSSDPMLNNHGLSRDHQGAQVTAGSSGKAKMLKRRRAILRVTSVSLIADRQFQATAPRIQLNQRLHAIRVLKMIVITFALLNHPYHVRKLCLNYLPSYNADSDVIHFLSPITFLLMYTNSAISPILYAFLNKNFRHSSLDLIFTWTIRCLRGGRGYP